MFSLYTLALSATALALALARHAAAFDITRNDNLVLYWGQNSYGATHSDTANFQKRLSFYCAADSVTNTFPLAFLTTFFGEGGLPSIDLSNICNINDNATFAGTELPNCAAMASDIETCQAAGKIVTISLGGATGAIGFTSDAQAEAFADTIWDLFLGGSSPDRPFGSAVLDGVDLDVEGGGSAHYAAFVTQLRAHTNGAGKPYFVTAAPQCPFPDANLGAVINAVAFDAVYVQFYNNFCGLQAFNNPNDWNFATWDTWARTVSPNKAVKVYIGAPAAGSAAGSGFVDAPTLAGIIEQTKSTFESFGGVMMWDASQAYANDRYDIAAKNALTGGASAPSPPPPPTSTTTKSASSSSSSSSSSASSSSKSASTSKSVSTTSTAQTAVPTAGSCAGVPAWSSAIAYNGGAQVTSAGHLWTAKWWSEADVPGGVAGDWQDDGLCTNAAVKLDDATRNPRPAPSTAEPASGAKTEANATPVAAQTQTVEGTAPSETPALTKEPRAALRFDRRGRAL